MNRPLHPRTHQNLIDRPQLKLPLHQVTTIMAPNDFYLVVSPNPATHLQGAEVSPVGQSLADRQGCWGSIVLHQVRRWTRWQEVFHTQPIVCVSEKARVSPWLSGSVTSDQPLTTLSLAPNDRTAGSGTYGIPGVVHGYDSTRVGTFFEKGILQACNLHQVAGSEYPLT